ncbi:DEAD/DEAH box helicase [Amycolatopsis sp. CA-230715]|uniref:DEAD/DEAH box helicase n=1 Tax=Amycolatopsis sp. CA-230715 TaxID=2745196 RepID=UPI001C015BC5|nr:DEAD/DEAH box helicase [Amycolatopsis sp. CA-230715]QWF82143.1 ATP-dependent RNA helicase RhlE [Amycolatopsis sp. CA-230715]
MADSRPDTSFAALGVPADLVAALAAQGVDTPFPIQAATLPHSLAGRDVLGRGRTGSGKTYAFVLPLLARLAERPVKRRASRPRALILAPTRELASQIDAAIAPLAKALSLRSTTIFGGVSANPQISAVRGGVDIVVACPGRLEDLTSSGDVRLDDIEITVLDEADHMADLGFLPVVRKLLDRTPRDSQRMLFSATLDAGVDVLVKRYLTDPVTHSVDSARSPVATMKHHVLHVVEGERLEVLAQLASAPGRSVVFTRTKYRAKALAKQLVKSGVPAVELHGNLGQNARTRNLSAFSDGSATTLVATDIAARGIHVDDVARVIHADPPVEHKAYLHRSGRTARAGAEGTVITLMTDAQIADVRDLTKKAGIKPNTTRVGPGHALLAQLAPGERTFVPPPAAAPKNSGGGSRGSAGRSGPARSGPARSGPARSGSGRSGAANGSGRRSANGSARQSASGSARDRSAANGSTHQGAGANGSTRQSANGSARQPVTGGGRRGANGSARQGAAANGTFRRGANGSTRDGGAANGAARQSANGSRRRGGNGAGRQGGGAQRSSRGARQG